MFTTTAYNTLGEAQEKETLTDSWKATEICLDFSMLYGYAETTDLWGRHYGCLLYTSPSPRDVEESRMPSSA